MVPLCSTRSAPRPRRRIHRCWVPAGVPLEASRYRITAGRRATSVADPSARTKAAILVRRVPNPRRKGKLPGGSMRFFAARLRPCASPVKDAGTHDSVPVNILSRCCARSQQWPFAATRRLKAPEGTTAPATGCGARMGLSQRNAVSPTWRIRLRPPLVARAAAVRSDGALAEGGGGRNNGGGAAGGGAPGCLPDLRHRPCLVERKEETKSHRPPHRLALAELRYGIIAAVGHPNTRRKRTQPKGALPPANPR
jgi:hypothetical protein